MIRSVLHLRHVMATWYESTRWWGKVNYWLVVDMLARISDTTDPLALALYITFAIWLVTELHSMGEGDR